MGGGSSAHVLIPFLSSSGHKVNLVTRKPENWSKNIELQYHTINNEVINTYHGELNKVTSDVSEVIEDTDVVILCMPVCKYRIALDNAAKNIPANKKIFIGTIYGQAGFNWMVDEIKQKYSLANVTTFAFGLIPWICRTIEYGKVGVTYGSKEVNVAAVSPKEDFEFLNKNIFENICLKWFNTGSVLQSENFISLTLSVDNQIIHTSRCYGLDKVSGGKWDKETDVPLFYRDYDKLSADYLLELDNDYSKIREEIIRRFPEKNFDYMLDYLALERLSYQSANTDIKESFTSSQTLGAIKTPVIENSNNEWVLNINHRFFTDDIHYGNCIAKWIAEELNIDVPMIDRLINWAQELRSEKLMENNKLLLDSEDLRAEFISGIPVFYGYKTIDEIID